MGILDLIFPKSCLGCKRPGKYLCPDCLTQVPMGSAPALYSYRGVIRKAILALKYKFAYDIALDLAEASLARLKTGGNWPRAILVPVPLHFRRERWRGFNQAAVVGKLIAEGMNWKYSSQVLVRDLASRPQVGLSGKNRLRNIRGKFAVNMSRRTLMEWNRYSVVLFDDVFTTGATLREAKSVLRKAGVGDIRFLTIAG